jgi:hypothetical protein
MYKFFRLTTYEATARASLAAIHGNGEMTWQELTNFSKVWLESISTAIGNGWAKPTTTAISTQLAAFQVFYRRSTHHFREITTKANALRERINTTPDSDLTRESVDLWNAEIRNLRHALTSVPRELQNHVVGLILNLARTVDEGVEALHAEDMALWKQALIGIGNLMDKAGKEAARNTAAIREVALEIPEIAKKGLNTAGVALIAAGVIGAVFIVPPMIRATRKD